MALLFVDSFDHYATAQIGNKWNCPAATTGATTITSSGRNSTSGAFFDAGEYIGKIFDYSISTWIVGMAARIVTLPTSTALNIVDIGGVQESGYLANITLAITSTGALSVTATSLLGTTAAGVIIANTYHYIEWKTYIHDLIGTTVVKVDGITVLTVSAADTKAQTIASNVLRIGKINGVTSGNLSIDDLYVCDNTGTTNNDFLGDVRIECILPSGAGTTTQFTASAGSNYQCVDDATPNDDTDYIGSSTVGHKDTYAFGNLATASGNVYGVQTNIWTRKTNSGTGKIVDVIRSDGADYDGSVTMYNNLSYAYRGQIHETDPDTSTAWTITTVNAAEFGVKIVA